MIFIRYIKQIKTELFSSKLVRVSKQITYVNILAPVRDNPSKCSLLGRPESQLKSQLLNPGNLIPAT